MNRSNILVSVEMRRVLLALIVAALMLFVAVKAYMVWQYASMVDAGLANELMTYGMPIDRKQSLVLADQEVRVRTEWTSIVDSSGATIMTPAQIVETRAVPQSEWVAVKEGSQLACDYLVLIESAPMCLGVAHNSIMLSDLLSPAARTVTLVRSAPHGIQRLVQLRESTYIVWIDDRLRWTNFLATLFMREGGSGPLLVMARELRSDGLDLGERVLKFNDDYLP